MNPMLGAQDDGQALGCHYWGRHVFAGMNRIESVQGKEKAWGPDVITVILSTVNNLGILYTDQGKLDEAEKVSSCTSRRCKDTRRHLVWRLQNIDQPFILGPSSDKCQHLKREIASLNPTPPSRYT